MTELVTKFIRLSRQVAREQQRGRSSHYGRRFVKANRKSSSGNEFIPANSYDAWMRRGIPRIPVM